MLLKQITQAYWKRINSSSSSSSKYRLFLNMLRNLHKISLKPFWFHFFKILFNFSTCFSAYVYVCVEFKGFHFIHKMFVKEGMSYPSCYIYQPQARLQKCHRRLPSLSWIQRKKENFFRCVQLKRTKRLSKIEAC